MGRCSLLLEGSLALALLRPGLAQLLPQRQLLLPLLVERLVRVRVRVRVRARQAGGGVGGSDPASPRATRDLATPETSLARGGQPKRRASLRRGVCMCIGNVRSMSMGVPVVRAGALPGRWHRFPSGSSPRPAVQQTAGPQDQRARQLGGGTSSGACRSRQAGTQLRARTFCPMRPCRFSFSRVFNGAWPCLLSPRLTSGCAQPNMRVCASRTLGGRTIVAKPQARGVPRAPCRRPKEMQLELAAPCAETRPASLEHAACMASSCGGVYRGQTGQTDNLVDTDRQRDGIRVDRAG